MSARSDGAKRVARWVCALGFTLVALASGRLALSAEPPQSVVKQAISAAERGAYDDAVAELEALADRGYVHPDASYARAYAYVERARSRAKRPGDLGRAVAALEEVQVLRPSSNVEPALATLRSEISRLRVREGNTEILQRPLLGRAVAALLSENTWAVLSILGSGLLTVGLALYLFVKRRSADIAGATASVSGLVVLAVSGSLCLAARHYRTTSRPAVVVVPEARLLDAEGRALPTQAKAPAAVPEGSFVYVHEQHENYSHVEWGALDGWLESSALELLSEHE